MAIRQSTYPELIAVIEDISVIARERRRKKRMTLRQAAEACGLSASAYRAVEIGVGVPTGYTILAILRWCSYK